MCPFSPIKKTMQEAWPRAIFAILNVASTENDLPGERLQRSLFRRGRTWATKANIKIQKTKSAGIFLLLSFLFAYVLDYTHEKYKKTCYHRFSGVLLTASYDFAQYVSMFAMEGPERREPLPTTPKAGNSPPSLLSAAKTLQHVCLFLCLRS